MPGAIFARVLSLALIQFGPLAGQDFESIAKKISPSWVKITAFDQDRASTAGSGFFVAPDGIIVTDRQVVGDYANIVIQTADGIKHTGIAVEATDEIHGLVLLRIANVSTGVPLTLGSPWPGQKVAVVSPQARMSAGLISDVMWAPSPSRTEIVPLHPTARVSTPGTELIQMTASVLEGDSGSPVVNSSGEVIGLATYRSGMGENVNFAISSKHIKELLESRGLARESIAAAMRRIL
jgi:serine protease Do